MTLFLVHRINNVKILTKLKKSYGVECDVRDYKNQLVMSHDPFKKGINFNKYLSEIDDRIIFLNLKSSGIIKKILQKTKKKKIFFLDLSFSEINYLIEKNLQNKIVLRFSIYEKFNLDKTYFKKISWIWYDFFKMKKLHISEFKYFKQHNKKICIVSPELCGNNLTEIKNYIKHLNKNNINVDAICTKQKYLKTWKKFYKYS